MFGHSRRLDLHRVILERATRPVRYLVINGDDFGFSESVNRAIVRAHREGILTSCSLMVGQQAFEHAVELARSNPRLAVGIHLVLVLGRSVLPHARVSHLVDRDGNLPDQPWRAGLRYYFSRAAQAEMRLELEAQFLKFASTGLRLSHVDGHLNMHMHPSVFPVVAQLARRFGAARVRIPREEYWRHLRFDRRQALQKALWTAIFRALGKSARRRLNGEYFYPDRVYGLLQSGAVTEEYWLDLIPRMRGRVNEVYCHPCALEPGARHGDSVENGARELAGLLSDRVRRGLADAGLHTVSYAEVEAIPGR